MEFRRGGHRDVRRRRALMDEPDPSAATTSGESPSGSTAASTPSEPARRYSDAALSPRQPRVIDLIPTRPWTNLVLAALLLSTAAGIEALYGHLALENTSFDISQFPAIDLSVRGSVATWFSSAMLAACAIFGLLTYQLRRHRVDDYRGRYRMWCWVVPLFWLASIDQVAGIQESVRTALLYSSGIPDYADALLVWVASVALLTGAVGVRLLIEIRACRLASFLLLLSLAGLATVAAVQVGWLLSDASVLRTMVISGCTLGAHIALLMAMFLYARHVHRDACGQLPPARERKRRKVRKRRPVTEEGQERSSKSSESSRSKVRQIAGKSVRTDPPHQPSGQKDSSSKENASTRGSGNGSSGNGSSGSGSSGSGSRPARKEKRRVTADVSDAKKSSASGLCEPDDEQLETSSSRLSKAERKRQRKLRRKERQV